MTTTRIDKWLWAARMFKTRSLATKACAAGHVKLDNETVKASQKVVAGGWVEVLTPGGPRVLEIVGILDKRGPAAVAQTLYNDHTPEPEPIESPLDLRPRGLGRPTKRDRRQMKKIRGF
ncbi:MAG: RNA-binding S4 domain-containing protein [Myxococcota bacterium]|nr:RNA-binding S4 domain-containing protein [Myxococcota bacterium]